MKMRFFAASLLIAGASLSSMAMSNKDAIDYYKVGELGNAQELLTRNIEQSDNVAEAYYYLGMIAIKADDKDAAAKYFENGISQDAKYPYSYVGQGLLALMSKDDKGAKDAFSKARKNAGKDLKAKIETEIARAYNSVDAVAYAKDIAKCIETARKGKDANDPESYIFEGDNYTAQEKWGDAAGQYELAYNFDPENVEAHVKWANTYYNVNPELALANLEKYSSEHPNTALVQRQLAEKYYDDNQAAKAAEKYGEYVNNPNHFYLDEARYSQLLFFAKEYEKSFEVAQALQSKVDPSNSNMFFMQRMKFYNKMGLKDYQGAVAEGEKLFGMPVPALARYEYKDLTDYAVALQKTEQDAKAVEYLKKAYDLRPEIDGKPNLDVLRSLGDVYNNIKDYENCIKVTEQICATEDADYTDFYDAARRYYNLAVTTEDAEAKASATANARKYIDKAYAQNSENISIVRQLSRVDELEEGEENTGKAVNSYKRLIELILQKDAQGQKDYEPYLRSAYLYIANAAMKAGDKVTAKEYYQKRLEVDPENENLRNYLQNFK